MTDTEAEALRAENARLCAQKDAAYAERNKCVALIARMARRIGWTAGVGQHPALDVDWEDDWRTIVFVDLPTGQASWHFQDLERWMLDGLPAYGAPWDGHSTEEKYVRVLSALAPCGGSRCYIASDGRWLHPSKSYDTCAALRGTEKGAGE